MSVNSYLKNLASELVLSEMEKSSIKTSYRESHTEFLTDYSNEPPLPFRSSPVLRSGR